MDKGQWVRILHMEGEPRMTGKIGQYEFTDSIGQLHGTWGLGIQPDKDKYELISDEKAAEIQAEEERKRLAYVPPHIEGAKKVEVHFKSVPIVPRTMWVNGQKPTKEVDCVVILDLNGLEDVSRKDGCRRSMVLGLPDNQVRETVGRIRLKVGNCCPSVIVNPVDMRKDSSAVDKAIDEACRLAIGGN